MYPHWRYLLASLIGPIKAVSCRRLTQIPKRIDEAGNPFQVDVEDEVFATFEFASGALAQVTTSWATRVKRDDLIQIQIDGTLGSALAGGHKCFVQSLAATPKPVWNVEVPQAMNFDAQWQEVPDNEPFKNSYRWGWEQFLRHVARGRSAGLADAGRREGRAAHRALLSKRPRTALDRRAGAGFGCEAMTRGVIPVLYSFYAKSGALDLEAHERQIDWVMPRGAAGVTLLGLASEGASLTQDERKSVIARHGEASARGRGLADHHAPGRRPERHRADRAGRPRRRRTHRADRARSGPVDRRKSGRYPPTHRLLPAS